jgi:metal-responsive CopG/Arc/MetJ family transcriptional regulator
MPSKVEKITISVDHVLLARAERLSNSTGESRSALLARALRLLLRTEAHARQVEEYVDAYTRIPESASDERRARAEALRSLASLSWDDE